MQGSELVRKIIGVPIILGYANICFLIFDLKVYTQLETLLIIIGFCVVAALDLFFRPLFVSGQKDKYNPVILILFMLVCPFLIASPYFEGQWITKQYYQYGSFGFVYFIGMGLLAIGGLILTISRATLGEFGSVKLKTESEHRLITKGIYRFIRNPIYTGSIVLFFGYSIAFYGFITSAIILMILIPFYISRIGLEEKILTEKFGEEYKTYIKRTKRLIPFIY